MARAVLCRHMPALCHYLDDFVFTEEPGNPPTALSRACSLMKISGVPTAPHKVEGPSTCLTFLGIELDSCTLIARLPEDGLRHLLASLKEWWHRKHCLKQELLSLIGVLQHASTVVQFGRAFLRSIIDLAETARVLHHHLRLSREIRSELLWWASFAPL